MLPKAVVQLLAKELRVTDFAQHAFGDDRFVSLSMAAATVESYFAEAQRQQARVQRGHKAILAEFRRIRAWASNPSWTDDPPRRSASFPYAAIHFYANCWTVVGRHLTAIRDISGLPEVGRALRPHVRAFERFTALRDYYEHLDDRLPGRKNAHRVGGQFYGLMAGNTLTFGSRTIDVGPSSLHALRVAVRDVLDAFKRGAIALLAEDKPDRLQALARRARGASVSRTVARTFHKSSRQSG